MTDGYTDEELRARYRFGKESIQYITDLLADNLCRKTNRNRPLSALQQVLIALRFFASGSGSFLQVVGDTIGVNKSTVSRVVANVSLALVSRQQEYVKWPRQQQELGKLKTAFYRRGGFPCMIGCIDGTHIRIQAQNKKENSYVNRKGFHSTNVQGICNHEGNQCF